jgi:hypothetical protein
MRQIGGPISDYQGLVQALRARREALGISFAELEAFAELPTGYAAKILHQPPASMKLSKERNNWRMLGPRSFGAILYALGLALVVVEDPVAARSAKQLPKRAESCVRHRREP